MIVVYSSIGDVTHTADQAALEMMKKKPSAGTFGVVDDPPLPPAVDLDSTGPITIIMNGSRVTAYVRAVEFNGGPDRRVVAKVEFDILPGNASDKATSERSNEPVVKNGEKRVKRTKEPSLRRRRV